jgi:hypothetical protein
MSIAFKNFLLFYKTVDSSPYLFVLMDVKTKYSGDPEAGLPQSGKRGFLKWQIM